MMIEKIDGLVSHICSIGMTIIVNCPSLLSLIRMSYSEDELDFDQHMVFLISTTEG